LDAGDIGREKHWERSNGHKIQEKRGGRPGKEQGMKESRRGTKRREGMEERGFIEAAGKSSVIAL